MRLKLSMIVSDRRSVSCMEQSMKFIPWMLVFLAVSLAVDGATPRALASGDVPLAEFDIEFRDERVHKIVVPVTLASTTYQFEVDTGSTDTTFGERLRPLLRRRTGVARYSAVGSELAEMTYAAPRGSIGAVRLPRNMAVRCHDISAMTRSPKIDGILGMDALSGSILRLDFDRAKVSFLRDVPSSPGSRLELMRPDHVPTIVGSLDGYGTREFLLDTGFNGHAAINRRDFTTLVTRGRLAPAGAQSFRTAAGNLRSRHGVFDGALSLGRHTHSALAVVELPDDGLPFCLLGLDYLSRYVVTFDFPRNRVYLKPGAQFGTLRPATTLFGVRLARVAGTVVVWSVRERSRAAAYLQPDDVLETINGTAVAGMLDAEIVRRLMDPDRDVKLVFRRPADGAFFWMIRVNDPPPRASTNNAEEDIHPSSGIPGQATPAVR